MYSRDAVHTVNRIGSPPCWIDVGVCWIDIGVSRGRGGIEAQKRGKPRISPGRVCRGGSISSTSYPKDRASEARGKSRGRGRYI